MRNMSCEDILPVLSVYVDDEATPDEAYAVKAHTAVCPDCASHLAFLRATSFVLSRVPEVAPDPALFARIASATYARKSWKEQVAEKVALWLQPAPVRYGLGTAVAATLAAVVFLPSYLNRDGAPNLPQTGIVAENYSVSASDPTGTAAVTPDDPDKGIGNSAEPSAPNKSVASGIAPSGPKDNSARPVGRNNPAAVATQTGGKVGDQGEPRKPSPVSVAVTAPNSDSGRERRVRTGTARPTTVANGSLGSKATVVRSPLTPVTTVAVANLRERIRVPVARPRSVAPMRVEVRPASDASVARVNIPLETPEATGPSARLSAPRPDFSPESNPARVAVAAPVEPVVPVTPRRGGFSLQGTKRFPSTTTLAVHFDRDIVRPSNATMLVVTNAPVN